MRISGNASVDVISTSKPIVKNVIASENVVKQGSKTTQELSTTSVERTQPLDVNEETKAKVQEAVSIMNEMLEVNNSSSKFIYHEGLDRYYVTVVDRQTEEVIKEIPPEKLLDAYYEMQKMFGMIVDEKI